MFKITKPHANRVDIAISGKIDAAMMNAGLDELFALSEGMSGGVMLYTISDIEMPTLGALGVEISRLGKMFSLLGKFHKCAVVSDHGWIRTAAEIEGALLPGLVIKSFSAKQRDAAESWLAA